MSLLDRIWGGKRVEPAPPEDTADYWLNQGFVLGMSGQHEEATKCFENAKALKLDKNPIKFTIPIKDYALYYPIISDLLGMVDVKLIGNKHLAYCTKCGVQFRKEALEMLCMAQAFKKYGSELSVRKASTQGNDLRAGRCPNCRHSEMAITVEVQGIVPPREEDTAEAPATIGKRQRHLRPVESLIQALKGKDQAVQEEAALSLGELGDTRAIEPLIQALKDKDCFVRGNASMSLVKIGKPSVEPLIQALKDKDPFVRRHASKSLGEIDDVRAVEPLIRALKDEDEDVRVYAATALIDIGKPSVELLIQASNDEDKNVRATIAYVLGAIKDAETYYRKGKFHYNQNMSDKAIKYFDKAIELDPEHAKARYYKGNSLYIQGKYDDAIKAYDEAIRLNPNDAAAWNNNGNALGKQGKYDDAIKSYDEAIRLNPNLLTLAQAWYGKGVVLESLDRNIEAEAAFAKARELGSQQKSTILLS